MKTKNNHVSFVYFTLPSDRIDPGWKSKLQIPPKDNRIKTSVSLHKELHGNISLIFVCVFFRM